MLKLIWLKVSAFFIAASGVFYLLFQREKSKRKAAELEAETEKENRKLLEKEKVIITDLDNVRDIREARQDKHIKNLNKQIQDIKNETDNSIVTDKLIGLLDKDDNKD